MKIGGIIDISTKDIPHKSAMVIFLIGCNYNCQFCHNKYLLQDNVGKNQAIEDLLSIIRSNLLVSCVSITGGEPTLQSELPELCKKIQDLGKYVSVDTNGSNPKMMERLIHHVDRIAMDLKSDPRNEKLYQEISNSPVEIQSIMTTLNLVNRYRDVDFEIRTTFVKPLISAFEIKKIIRFLKEVNFHGSYVIQQYQYSDGVGDQFKDKFQKPEHGTLINAVKPFKNEELPFQIYIRDEIVGYSNINDLFNMKIEDV